MENFKWTLIVERNLPFPNYFEALRNKSSVFWREFSKGLWKHHFTQQQFFVLFCAPKTFNFLSSSVYRIVKLHFSCSKDLFQCMFFFKHYIFFLYFVGRKKIELRAKKFSHVVATTFYLSREKFWNNIFLNLLPKPQLVQFFELQKIRFCVKKLWGVLTKVASTRQEEVSETVYMYEVAQSFWISVVVFWRKSKARMSKLFYSFRRSFQKKSNLLEETK